MKGLIITLTGNYNYGNRLQNYALQHVLEKEGLEIETFNNIYPSEETIKIKKQLRKINIKYIILAFKNKVMSLIKCKNNKKIEDRLREEKIKNFTSKYIKTTSELKDELLNKYDVFFLGSDQIWNPNFINDFEINLVTKFINKPVIAYAASFGVKEIDSKLSNIYKQALNNIKAISVRENSGKDLVARISNKDAKVVLDPTMLISVEEWRKFERKPDKTIKEKYLFVYCVGSTFEKNKNKISKIALENDLKIINLTNKQSKEYISGVEEFLYYIDNAEFVITDSFHACVFSILFRKNFLVIDRDKKQEGMNERINTLLKQFDLEKINFNNYTKKINDYYKIDLILEQKRKEAFLFLKSSLE